MPEDTTDDSQLDQFVAEYLSSGDQRAFEQLVIACNPMLLAIIARNFRGSRDIVLELEQETWLKLEIRRREDQKCIVPETFTAFKKYVLKIAKNLAIDHWRTARSHPVNDPLTDELADNSGTRDLSASIEVKRCVDELRQSSQRDAEIIELCYLQRYTAAELAIRFGLNEGHIRRIREKSLDCLRRCIEGKHS